ncbi:hypothetical protein GW846_03540 [Candidatus Gracilibacteria bacterium]|nr:hypothetical protein [Candidatus Gracilibacteria bacterium]
MLTHEAMLTKMKKLTDRPLVLNFYIEEVKHLEKKESALRVSDLDDTLFGRGDQLESEVKLRENRGASGIDVIINDLGLHTFIQEQYHTDFPRDILDLLDPKIDIILTAGMVELQRMKAQKMQLDNYTVKIVDTGIDKIMAVIQYVIFELKYIPSEIIVYEDRPEYFIEYRELMESLLGTKLTIMFVEMNGNDGYKSIQEV